MNDSLSSYAHFPLLFQIALDLFRRPSPSGHEDLVRAYVVQHLKCHGFSVSVDDAGNVLAARGKPAHHEGYPLLAFHMDCVSYNYSLLTNRTTVPSAVHSNSHLTTDTLRQLAKRQRQMIPSQRPIDALEVSREWLHTRGQFVLGGDDKCGGAIALTLAATTTLPLKIVASVEEEIGCIGIEQVDPAFFEDVAYALVLDRRGANHLIVSIAGRLLCQGSFAAEMTRVAAETGLLVYSVEGASSDALTLSHYIPNVVNLSVGYYHPHTVEERVSLFDLWRSYQWTQQALRSLPCLLPNPNISSSQQRQKADGLLCSVCQKLAITPTDLSKDLWEFTCHCGNVFSR